MEGPEGNQTERRAAIFIGPEFAGEITAGEVSTMDTVLMALFLALGHHDSLVRRLSHAFRDRWRVMGDALAVHLPDRSRMPIFGGTAYWVRGPRRLEAA